VAPFTSGTRADRASQAAANRDHRPSAVYGNSGLWGRKTRTGRINPVEHHSDVTLDYLLLLIELLRADIRRRSEVVTENLRWWTRPPTPHPR
jgi:hypothetical protein